MSGLRLIGRTLAVFIVLTFVAITPPLMLAYHAQQAALNGDFVEELVQEEELFEELLPEIAQDLAEETRYNLDTRDMPIARLDAKDWERILFVITPPERLRQWTEEALQGFRRWVRRGGPFLDDVILPFGEIRDRIINDPEQTVLHTLTQAQPPCSGGQEPLSGPGDLIPQCRPPISDLESFYRRLGQRWQGQPQEVWRQMMPPDLARYPDDVSVADFIEEESGEEWWEVRTGWRVSRWGLRAARWFLAAFITAQCLVALGLVALFAARNLREALRWVGTPLVLAGGFALLLAFALLLGGEIGTFFIPAKEVPVGAQEVVENSVRVFVRDLWPPMAWQGGVLALIGLGMWALSFFAPGERRAAPVAVTHEAPSEPANAATSEQVAPPQEKSSAREKTETDQETPEQPQETT